MTKKNFPEAWFCTKSFTLRKSKNESKEQRRKKRRLSKWTSDDEFWRAQIFIFTWGNPVWYRLRGNWASHVKNKGAMTSKRQTVELQRPIKWLEHGLVKFLPAFPWLFCLALPGSFLNVFCKPFFGSCTYRDWLKSMHQVWWILFLLLLSTPAWPCLQHSRNLGPAF